jgi:hypothetical protein
MSTLSPGEFVPATKRKVTISAALFDGGQASAHAIIHYARARGSEIVYHPPVTHRVDGSNEIVVDVPAHLEVVTKEGRMVADAGAFVLEGVDSEFYPCDPSIFGKTYTGGPLDPEGDDEDLADPERPVHVNVHQAADNWPMWLNLGLTVVVVVGVLVTLAKLA